jgi:hypothetical protein
MIHRNFSMLVCLAGAAGLSIALSTSALATTGPAAGGASGANVAVAGPATSSSTFVKVFSNSPVPQGALTTEDVQPTSDGGHVVLADTGTANGVGVSWLLKLDSTGNPQFQEEVGCFNTAPGDNALAHSVQQTSDGGYILGGGTVGCGSASSACPEASGISCAYVVKLDSAGDVVWADVYNDGAQNADISQIKQTSDGGYIAVGSADNANGNTSGLVLKLDSSGNVQFQREFAPSGSTTNILLNTVRQTSDGGYITAGQFTTSGGSAIGNELAIKLSSVGKVQFENGYEHVVGGTTVDRETVTSVIQTSDGGFLIGGDWNTSNGTNNNGPHGGLLLKLTSTGSIQFQHSYTNTLPNGDIIGSEINSVSQLPNGGFLLAGAADLLDSTNTVVLGLVPYLAETDSSGNLTQQNLYTELSSVGRPTSQDFAAADLLSSGGALAAGFTEDPASGIGDLYLVKTDSAGQVGTKCNNVQSAPALIDGKPSLAPVNVRSSTKTTVDAPASSPTTVVTGTPTFTRSC